MSAVITAFSIKCEDRCAVNHAGRSGMAAEFNQTFELDGSYEAPHEEIFIADVIVVIIF